LHGGGLGESELPEECYRNSLKLALAHKLNSIASLHSHEDFFLYQSPSAS